MLDNENNIQQEHLYDLEKNIESNDLGGNQYVHDSKIEPNPQAKEYANIHQGSHEENIPVNQPRGGKSTLVDDQNLMGGEYSLEINENTVIEGKNTGESLYFLRDGSEIGKEFPSSAPQSLNATDSALPLRTININNPAILPEVEKGQPSLAIIASEESSDINQINANETPEILENVSIENAVNLDAANIDDQPPENIEISNDVVVENATVGTVVGTISAIDPDNIGAGFTYSLDDDAGGRFQIVNNELQVADGTLLDFENADSHTVTVRVKENDSGTENTETFTIHVQNSDDVAPEKIELSNDVIVEKAKAGTLIGNLTAIDPDNIGTSFTYSLDDDAGGRFQIVNNELQVADGRLLNYENADSHSITVRVKENDSGAESTETFTIHVQNVDDEAPENLTLRGDTVVENAKAGTMIGIFSAVDPDNIGTHFTYSLEDDAGGRFKIFKNQIQVADSSLLDYETNQTHTITVKVTENDSGQFTTEDFTINLKNINEAPEDLFLSNNTIDENSPKGTYVGTATTQDQDTGESFTYSLLDDAGGRFAIDVKTGAVTVADESKLDYETSQSHDITIEVEDSGGLTYNETFTINLNDVSEPGLTIYGTNKDDVLSGGPNDDQIYGLNGDDIMYGGQGNDFLVGGGGEDIYYGQEGNDVFAIGGGSDQNSSFYGGEGYDIILNLGGNITFSNDLTANNSIEEIIGNNRKISGDNSENIFDFSNTKLTDVREIRAHGGDDFIKGSQGDDTIRGDSGDDVIYGEGGDDILHGDQGNDLFIFNENSGSDIVDAGGGNWIDTIRLNAADQAPGGTGQGSWILQTNDSFTIDAQNNTLNFTSRNAEGTITMNDGSEIDFTNIEKIEWS